MNIKNLKLKNVLIISMYILTYPLLKAFTSEGNKLLVFLDVLTITSIMMIVFGIIYNLYQKGHFDISQYVLSRKLSSRDLTGKQTDPEKYLNDREKERKDSSK